MEKYQESHKMRLLEIAKYKSNSTSMSLLIMVGVALDTMKQVEAQLVMRRYEGFIK